MVGLKNIEHMRETFCVQAYCIWIIICCLIPAKFFAQSPTDIRAYIDQYKTIAIEQERLYGIPAPITLAQGILESGAGQSGLAKEANNHFGIKAVGTWSGGIYFAWDDEPIKSKFRIYGSAEDSYEDHSKLIKNNSRYQSLFGYSVFDYRNWAIGLQRAGYATSTQYAKALIGYIDAYQLYTINGGVKLKPAKSTMLPQNVTADELNNTKQYSIDDTETTEEENELNQTIQKVVVEINEVRCTILCPGETLSSVAMRYNIAKRELLEFNETTDESDLKEGDIVYLEKKKRKYNGPKDYYRVKTEESLYDIAQQFGIKTSCLAKLNHKEVDSKLQVGERLKLK